MPKIIKEHFTSIHQMLSVIESRPKNKIMQHSNISETGDKSFTMTSSYNEAKETFQNGYTDVLEKIKTGVSANMIKTQTETRRRIRTGVVGYAPHVPNAIQGLPNSMILMERQQQKIKAVSIVVGICENCTTKAEEFVKSGIAALSVVNTLELRGYRVALKIAFYVAEAGNEKVFGTITLKDYREHMDIQKLCFPLCHPSMFRRFGFKWLETQPEIQVHDWCYGYGCVFKNKDFIQKNFLAENEFYIDLSTTRNAGYDVDKLIESMNLK